MRWRDARQVLVAVGALAGCGGGRSTLAVDIAVEPASLPLTAIRIVVRQGARQIVDRQFSWPGDGPRLGVYVPGDVEGEVQAMGSGVDSRGTALATGEGPAQVSPGKVSAPISLVLHAIAPAGDAGAPPDAGAPDADAPEAVAAHDADGPLDRPPPDAADTPPLPTAPTEAPRPLRPWNGEATGSVFAMSALRPRFTWAPAAGAATYDIEIDGSCVPETLASCPFSSPEVQAHPGDPFFVPAAPLEVSKTPPVGRRYAWRVRGCNAAGCGPWSPVRYVDVGRQLRDFNGDGYADLVASDMTGAVVFLGGPALDNRPDLTIALDPMSGAPLAPAGDVNADGYPDLLIGQPGPGKALLFYGGATLHATPDVTLTGQPDSFGHSLGGAGDIDADGFADLIIEGAESTQTAVHLFRGARQGTRPVIAFTLGSQPDDFIRAVSGAGDMNGDGYADVIASTRRTTQVFFGGAAFDTTPDMIYAAFAKEGDGLAALGDVDGDGYGDIIIVGPQVVIRRGGPTLVDQGVTLPENGSSASAGDLNGDGLADVVFRNMTHEAHLYLGGKAWDGGPSLALTGMPGDSFAVSVSVLGDVNGDGFADLAVGVSGRLVAGKDPGAVDLFLGGAVPHARADQTFVGPRADGGLGFTVAWLVPR